MAVVVGESGRLVGTVNRECGRIYGAAARYARWARGNPLPALTVVAFVLFGARWITYSYFYGSLDTSPAAVGLGFSDALAEASLVSALWTAVIAMLAVAGYAGLVAFVLLWLAVSFFVLAAFYLGYALLLVAPLQLLVNLGCRLAHRPRERVAVVARIRRALARLFGLPRAAILRVAHVRRELAPARQIVFALFVVTLLGVHLVMADLMTQAVRDARSGLGVEPLAVLGVPVLDVRAEPAEVSWTGVATPSPFTPSRSVCLLYLGESSGTTVLYDARSESAVRVPTAAVTVTTRPRGHC